MRCPRHPRRTGDEDGDGAVAADLTFFEGEDRGGERADGRSSGEGAASRPSCDRRFDRRCPEGVRGAAELRAFVASPATSPAPSLRGGTRRAATARAGSGATGRLGRRSMLSENPKTQKGGGAVAKKGREKHMSI